MSDNFKKDDLLTEKGDISLTTLVFVLSSIKENTKNQSKSISRIADSVNKIEFELAKNYINKSECRETCAELKKKITLTRKLVYSIYGAIATAFIMLLAKSI